MEKGTTRWGTLGEKDQIHDTASFGRGFKGAKSGARADWAKSGKTKSVTAPRTGRTSRGGSNWGKPNQKKKKMKPSIGGSGGCGGKQTRGECERLQKKGTESINPFLDRDEVSKRGNTSVGKRVKVTGHGGKLLF